MIPTRTPLAEYGAYSAYGPGLRGITRPLPFDNFICTQQKALKRREEEKESAMRRRDRLRELACEQWQQLVDSLSET
jgi:hypothetical protein